MAAPPTIDPKVLAEALQLQKEQDELRTRGLDKVREERNLMIEMAKISKTIGVNFNVHSKNIGSAVVEMSKLDRIGSIIESRSKENISLESNYIDLLKEQSLLENENSKLLNERDEYQIKNQIKILSVQNELNDLKDRSAYLAEDVTAEYAQQVVKLKQLKDDEVDFLEVSEYLIKLSDELLKSREDHLKNTAKQIELNRIIIKQHQEKAYQLKSFVGMADSLLPILGKTGNEFVTIGKNIVEAYKNGNLLGAAMAAVTEYLKIGVERFKELQETAEKFRKDTGLTLSQTSDISQYVKELNVQYQSMGVSLQEAYDSAKELMSELGNSKVLDNNKSLIQTSSLLAANYGVAAADAAGFQLSMMRAGENSAASAENMSVVAIKMSEAAGVSLPQVMKNVSAASGTTLAMVRGSNVELVKAAVHAKRFGLELATVAGAARKSLNFYESITDEMEASVLVGQQLSFQSARERAFAGDMVGFQNEILKTIGSIDKFGERSIFEQEAVAQAAGIELKELKKMLQVEEQLKKLSSTDRAEYDRLLKSNAKITEEDGKQLLKKQQIQSQLTRINNSFTAIKNKIGDSLQPALEAVATIIESIANLMGGTSKSVEDTGQKTMSVWKALGIVILAAAAGIGLIVASLKLVSILSGGLGKMFLALAKSVGGAIAGTLHSIGNGLTNLSGGLKSLGSPLAMKGAVTLAILAVAAIGVAFAFKLAADGIKLLLDSGVGFVELMAALGAGMLVASVSLWILSAGLVALGTAAPAAGPGVGILTVALLGLSLLAVAIGYSVKLMGEAFKLAGEGSKLFATSLEKLATIGGVGLIGVSAGIVAIAGAIGVLNAVFAASALVGIASLGGMLLTTLFLSKLSGMATELVLVGSALKNIANALERISNIKSFPKLEIPQSPSPSPGNTNAFVSRAAGETSEVSSEKEKSNNNIINKVDKLTESVDQLVQFMKSGGAIASVYINKRAMMKELAMQS